MYIIHTYDAEGAVKSSILANNMSEVGTILAGICNGNVKGNFPTVRDLSSNRLVSSRTDAGVKLNDIVNFMSSCDPNGTYSVKDLEACPGDYLAILRQWLEDSQGNTMVATAISVLECLTAAMEDTSVNQHVTTQANRKLADRFERGLCGLYAEMQLKNCDTLVGTDTGEVAELPEIKRLIGVCSAIANNDSWSMLNLK